MRNHKMVNQRNGNELGDGNRWIMKPFVETVATPETKDWIASRCDVSTDGTGYFIIIETDSYEGSAMITLPCAVKARAALGRAIKAAKQELADNIKRRHGNTETKPKRG
jgi:hypothetical protein